VERALEIRPERPSAQKIKRWGYKGSPCLSPLFGEKSREG
jgi:hypothetical protein